MATAATIKKNIAKLEAALKSKATPKSLKSKLETQLVKSKAELSGINKGAKPKTSTTKSTQTALQKLKEMVNKTKKLKTYKGAGVDLEKDADRPALPIGRRTAKQSGKTYYEYRANRIDVKQPPKRYPKLEKGGYMVLVEEVDRERMYNFLKDDLAALEKAIEVNNQEEINDIFLYWNRHLKDLEPKKGSKRMYEFLKDDLVGLEAATKELPSSKEETDRFFSYWNIHLKSLEYAKGGYMADGGEMPFVWKRKYGFSLGQKVICNGEVDEVVGFVTSDDEENYNMGYRLILKENGTQSLGSVEKYEKGGYMAKGGYFAEGGSIEKQNNDMLKSTIVEMKHHVDELKSVVSNNTEVEPWVIAKAERASTDLSDITHYLEGEKQKGLEMPFDKGGYFAEGGYVAVSEKNDYWTIISKPTTKEKAQQQIDLGVPRGEVGKVVTLEVAKAHKNTIGKEYLEKGSYMAKGGALEHGLMVGDTVRDVAENTVAIYNVNNRKSFVVDLDKGTRTEWIGSFKDRKKYAEKGGYMEMGGEMHRTQE